MDNTQVNQASTPGDIIALLDVGGVKHEKVIVEHLVGGVPVMTEAANPFPVTDAAALAQLVLILAKLSSDPATQTTLANILTKLNASIAVTGTFWQAIQQVSGTVTVDTSLLSTSAKQDLLLTELQLKADLSETQPVSLATLPALPAGTNNIGDIDVLTLPALAAGTNVIGKVGIDQATPGTTNKVSLGSDNINTVQVAPTVFDSGVTIVTTAGTRVQVASNTCKSVTVKAKQANTGKIYIGGSSVTSSNGFELSAGETVSMDISNTNLIYIDSSVNSEGISFVFIA